jgi:hypothetical protein
MQYQPVDWRPGRRRLPAVISKPTKGESEMNQDKRIIHRIGARELTEAERNKVTGGIRTLTICTVATERGLAGDEAGPETC